MAPQTYQTCVTSPPYWQLRDYGVDGQIGMEPSPEEYVDTLDEVFREVRRVLRDDGTLWLNIGDTYASGGNGGGGSWVDKRDAWDSSAHSPGWRSPPDGLKHKDLCGMPWRVAFALQEDGRHLRSDIIWKKSNAMPESVDDRPFKQHEYLFLLAKSERYYYDADAIKEPVSGGAHSRGDWLHPKYAEPGSGVRANTSFSAAISDRLVDERHRRTVWETSVSRYPEAHFATFPPDLVPPASSPGLRRARVCSTPSPVAGRRGRSLCDRGGNLPASS